MKQCFIHHERSKAVGDSPRLCYISKIDKEDCSYPRILHQHEENLEVFFILEGQGSFFIHEERYLVKKGDLVIYNSRIVHDELFRDVVEPLAWICLGVNNIKQQGLKNNALIDDNESPVLNAGEYGVLLRAGLPLLFETAVNHQDALTETVDYFFKGIWQIVEQLVDGRRVAMIEEHHDPLVAEIKDYIDNHFAEPITLSGLEKRWPISKYHFSHRFKEFYDYTRMDYLKLRRIGEAQTLLIWSDLSISEIAQEVGFNSDSYFVTVFKRIVSKTPVAYRKYFLEEK